MSNDLQQYRSTHPPKEKRINLGAIEIYEDMKNNQLVDELIAFGKYNNRTHTHPDFTDLGLYVEMNDQDMILEVYQKMIEKDTVYNKRMLEEYEGEEGRLKDMAKAIKNMLSEREAKIEQQTEVDQLLKLADKHGFKLVRN